MLCSEPCGRRFSVKGSGIETVKTNPELELRIHQSVAEVKQNLWNRLVENSCLGSVFHRHEWLKTIEEGLGWAGHHFVVYKNANPIALLPNVVRKHDAFPLREMNSLRPGFGGLVAGLHEKESFDLIFNDIERNGGKTAHLHRIRSLNLDHIRYGRDLEKHRYRMRSNECRLVIDLRNGEAHEQPGISKSKLNRLKKTLMLELEIRDEEISELNLNEFYAMYLETMQRVAGKAYPLQFFLSMKENMAGRLKLWRLIVEGNTLAFKLQLLDLQRSSVHAFISAADHRFLKLHPSELLHRHLVSWSRINGFREYDFGSTQADFSGGTFQFKFELGGLAKPVLVWEKESSPLTALCLKAARRLYRMRPKGNN